MAVNCFKYRTTLTSYYSLAGIVLSQARDLSICNSCYRVPTALFKQPCRRDDPSLLAVTLHIAPPPVTALVFMFGSLSNFLCLPAHCSDLRYQQLSISITSMRSKMKMHASLVQPRSSYIKFVWLTSQVLTVSKKQ
ncbi:hypothetical protein J6590_063071 [Homalodisca vitripennis]|nr:hypothetical protein J6590_063071 [Homalodisca vitripennis]